MAFAADGVHVARMPDQCNIRADGMYRRRRRLPVQEQRLCQCRRLLPVFQL